MNASVEKAINHQQGTDVSRDVTLVEAVNMALARAMENDDNVVVLGEDIATNGGVFRATVGLKERTKPMVESVNSIAYSAYTTFYTHAESMCFYLQSEAFQVPSPPPRARAACVHAARWIPPAHLPLTRPA